MAYDDFNATAGSGVCEYLTESQSLVILYLSIRSSRETGEAFPSQMRIAYETGLKKKTVQKAITALRRLDIIRSRRAWSQTSRTLVTYYRVAPPDHIDAVIAEWDRFVIAVRDASNGKLNVLKLQRRLFELTPPIEENPLPGEQLSLETTPNDPNRPTAPVGGVPTAPVGGVPTAPAGGVGTDQPRP